MSGFYRTLHLIVLQSVLWNLFKIIVKGLVIINIITFPYFGWEFHIERVAFSIFGRPIYWYGLIITTAIILGAIYLYHTLPSYAGMTSDDVSNGCFIGVISAIVCARIYYVIFIPHNYGFFDVFKIWEGGIAIYGAIIGAFASMYIFCRIKKLPFLRIMDIVVITLLLGQFMGRWGNFVNGEAFGGPTNLPWAMSIHNGMNQIADMVHPTFFYESIWCLIGFVALLLYKRHKKFDGEMFLLYIAFYGLGRMFIEGLRTDSLMLGGVRVSQWLAAVSFLSALSILVWVRIKLHKKAA